MPVSIAGGFPPAEQQSAMPHEIFREFTFDAAHRLDHLPPTHKCARLHGHTYRLILHVSGPLDPEHAWIMDFAEIKTLVAPTLAMLDHHYLNDVPGLDKPTVENIAAWIWERLKPVLPALYRITLYESDSAGCVYTDEE